MTAEKLRVGLGMVAAVFFAIETADAAIVLSTDPGDFTLTPVLFPTSSFSTAPIVSTGSILTLSRPFPDNQAYREFDAVLLGEEYVMSGFENFDATFSAPQTVFAFDYSDNADDSDFTFTFFDGATNVGSESFTMTAPFNTAKFLGFASSLPFDKVEVREVASAGNTNEYFQFHTGTLATVAAVPEPGSMMLFGFAAGAGALRRRWKSAEA